MKWSWLRAAHRSLLSAVKGGKNCCSQERPNRRGGMLPEKLILLFFFSQIFLVLLAWSKNTERSSTAKSSGWRHPLFSQCDPADGGLLKLSKRNQNHGCAKRTTLPHCTGRGIRSDGGSSARSGCAKQRSLLCPLSEHLRPIPTEVPCGHFWRHLLSPKVLIQYMYLIIRIE